MGDGWGGSPQTSQTQHKLRSHYASSRRINNLLSHRFNHSVAVVNDGERRAIPLYRNVRHVTGTVLVVGVVDELFTTHDDLFDNIVMEVDTLTANKKTGLTMMKMALSTVSTVSTVPFAGPQSLK